MYYCRFTGSLIDPIDFIECGGLCEECPNEKKANFEGLMPVFVEKTEKIDRKRQKKYDKNHIKTVSARVNNKTAEDFKAYCQAKNTTRHAMIKAWIESTLKGETPGRENVNSTDRGQWRQL